MALTTIPKNRVEAFLPRIHNVRCYSLDNAFRGQPVPNGAIDARYIQRFEPKNRFDKAAMSGTAHVHSNLWFDFGVTP